MALITVATHTVRLVLFQRYEELIGEVANAAVRKREKWNWTAHQVAFGEAGTLHYATLDQDFAAIQQRGQVDDMVRRVMGEKPGNELLREVNECMLTLRQTVSMDRPDLSYPAEFEQRAFPAALVTLVRAQPGKQEACEELIRKVAEAIPKLGEPARILTRQTLIGDPLLYWTVRPLDDLSQLDEQRWTAALLEQAFGAAEGGLIYRSGLEAIERAQRSISLYREDLSNPASR
jgi:hypothetical protein